MGKGNPRKKPKQKKIVIIRDLERIEGVLGLDVHDRIQLKSLDLQKNKNVHGVKKLLNRIPEGYDIDKIRQFEQNTGLELRVSHYDSNCNLTQYDGDGPLIPPYAPEGVTAYEEWTSPFKHCDIEVRYIDEIKKHPRKINELISSLYGHSMSFVLLKSLQLRWKMNQVVAKLTK